MSNIIFPLDADKKRQKVNFVSFENFPPIALSNNSKKPPNVIISLSYIFIFNLNFS